MSGGKKCIATTKRSQMMLKVLKGGRMPSFLYQMGAAELCQIP